MSENYDILLASNNIEAPEEKILCFGHVISLGDPNDVSSFLYTEGFMKHRIFLKQFKEVNSFHLYSKSLFQLLPQFNNSYKKQLVNISNNLDKKDLQNRKEFIEEAQEKLLDEYKLNLEGYEKYKNTPITYGQIVQFLHITSNKLLSVTSKEAELEKENYQIELSEYSTDSTFFKILPSYKYQKESEGKIFLNETVYITHAFTAYINKTMYLHCSQKNQKKEKQALKNELPTVVFKEQSSKFLLKPENNTNQNQKFMASSKISKIKPEINASMDNPTRWRIHLYSFPDEKLHNDYLSYGDAIWINNIDNNVTVVGMKSALDQNIFFLKQKEEKQLLDEVKINLINSNFTDEITSYIGNKNGLWVIENEDFQKGGLIEINHFFRIKHLNTGKYFCVKSSTKALKTEEELELDFNKEESSIFQFKKFQETPDKQFSKFIEKDGFIKIQHKRSKKWIGINLNFVESKVNHSILNYLNEESAKLKLILKEKVEDQDSFKIALAGQTEIIETNFLISCMNLLNKYLSLLFKMEAEKCFTTNFKIFEYKTKNLEKCLNSLFNFLTNQSFNITPDMKFGTANAQRQKLLKELFYFEILFQILRVITTKQELSKFKKLQKKGSPGNLSPSRKSKIKSAALQVLKRTSNDYEPEGWISRTEEMMFFRSMQCKETIISLIYKILTKMCQNHAENANYVFNYLPFIFYQLQYVPMALEFVILLISNNEVILKKIGEKINLMDEMSFHTLNELIENEVEKDQELEREEGQEEKGEKFYHIVRNLLSKKKKTWLESKVNPRTFEKNDEKLEIPIQPLTVEKKRSFNVKDLVSQIYKENLILLILMIIRKSFIEERNDRFLKFFRSICIFRNKGIVQNQEIIYKLLQNINNRKAFLINIKAQNDDFFIEDEIADGKKLEDIMDLETKKNYKNTMQEFISLRDRDKSFISLKIENNSVFDKSKNYNEEKKEEFISEFNYPNQENKSIKLIVYINEQIKLYANLAMTRNSLWKKHLENIFPIKLLFNQINNKKLLKETRSAFTNLILSLYIDQEPLNETKFPKICQIFRKSEEEIQLDDEISKICDKTIYLELLNTCFKYINQKTTNILKLYTKLNSKLNCTPSETFFLSKEKPESPRKVEKKAVCKNYLDNILLSDVIKLLSSFTKFNIFELTIVSEKYFEFFPNLIALLEFDSKNPLVSKSLLDHREEKYKLMNSENKKNIVKTGISGIKNLLGTVFENVSGLTKDLAGTLFLGHSLGERKKVSNNTDYLERFNENFLYNHPIMRGMIAQKNFLQSLISKNETKDIIEKQIKIMICDTLLTFLERRTNFLVSNFIAWYQTLTKKYASFDEINMRFEIDEDLSSLFPKIMKSGIDILDTRYQMKDDDVDYLNLNKMMGYLGGKMQNLLGAFNLMENEPRQYKMKKFKIYTNVQEIPDLDVLLTGIKEENQNVSKIFLPSLLVSFYLNEDFELDKKLLELLTKCFNQRFEFARSLIDLELLFEEKDISTYNFIQQNTFLLRSIIDKSEAWITSFIKTGEEPVELQNMIELLKDSLILYSNDKNVKEIFNKEEVLNNLDNANISPVRQKIGFYYSIHQIALNFYKENLYNFQKMIVNEIISKDSKIKFLKIYELILKWLRLFVKKNAKHQLILFEEIEFFFNNLDIDLGQIDLICEIYKNNFELIKNVKDRHLKKFVTCIKNFGCQRKFLSFFEVIQVCRNEYILDNQAKIIDYLYLFPLQESQETLCHVLCCVRRENEGLVFSFERSPIMFTNEERMIKSQFPNNLYGDEPVDFHIKLLNLFIISQNGTEGFNLNNPRIKKIFSFKFLLEILVRTDELFLNKRQMNAKQKLKKAFSSVVESHEGHSKKKNEQFIKEVTKLKPKVLEFYSKIYFRTPEKNYEKFNTIIEFLQNFIRNEKERLMDFEQTFFTIPEFIDYYFGKVLPFFNKYIKFIMKDELLSNEEGDREDNELLYFIAEILEKNLGNLKNTLNADQEENLKVFFSNYFEITEEVNNKIHQCFLQKEDAKFEFNESKIQPEDFQFESESFISWKQFLDLVLHADSLENEIQNERNCLSETIYRIDFLFSEEWKKKYKFNMEMKHLLGKLINFLQFSIPDKTNKQTNIYVIQILIGMVKNSRNKYEIQNIMDKNNSITMILNVLAEAKNNMYDDEILDQLLSFLITLLEGCNINLQKTIHNYFLTVPSGEYILHKFFDVIEEEINLLKIKNDDTKEENHESTEKKASFGNINKYKPSILEKVLRILKLFTEGHFLELQNYMRYQINSRINHDLVSQVIELLHAYHSNITEYNYDNVLLCLKTLTEFVQGPCVENQTALIEGKFFDVAYKILSAHIPKYREYSFSNVGLQSKNTKTKKKKSSSSTSPTKSPNGKFRKRKLKAGQLRKWMMERLKYQTIVLVSSLLEMKMNDNVVKRIIRSLPIEILKKNMADLYKRYKKTYGLIFTNESLKHYEGDPRDKNCKNEEKYYELIIETGFLEYFLLNEYLEIINDEELDTNLFIFKKMKENNFVKNSIIGQIGSFLIAVIKYLLDTMKKYKNEIYIYWESRKSGVLINNESKTMELQKQRIKEAWRFFGKNSAHIEILRNDDVEKVYFILNPICQFLPLETQAEFDENVDRGSQKAKVTKLVERSDEFIKIALHEERLNKFFDRYAISAIFAKYVNLWKDIAFTMTIIINIFIFSSYSDYPRSYLLTNQVSTKERLEKRLYSPNLFREDQYSSEETRFIIKTCGIAMIISSSFVILFFLVKKAPLIIEKAWKKEENILDDFHAGKKTPFLSRIFKYVNKISLCVFFFLQNFQVLFYIAYGLFALFAITIHEFFFCFHLVEILIRYPTLKNVVRAVWEPKKALFLTFLLLIILEYSFTLWGFSWVHQDYQGNCETLIMCLLFTFDQTWKANGGVGGYLSVLNDPIIEANPALPRYTYNRFFYDNLFNIVIVLLMCNIVAGIIIDTFSMLRDQENEKIKDIRQICFICGQNKEVFDRQVNLKGGFLLHINKDHNKWNYVFFISYLKNKINVEYTGIESYVNKKMKQKDISWIPAFRSLALKNSNDPNQIEQKQKIEKFKADMNSLVKDFKKVKDGYEVIAKHLMDHQMKKNQKNS